MSIKQLACAVLVLGVLGCESASDPGGSALSSAQPQAAGAGGSGAGGSGVGGSGAGGSGVGGSGVGGSGGLAASGGSEAAGAGGDPEAGGGGAAEAGAAGEAAGGHPHAGGAVAGGAGAEEGVSFSKDVMPIFEKSCADCHQHNGYIHPYLGPQAQMTAGQVHSGLLASEGFMGDRAVVPGSPETSWLIGKLTGEMSAFACAAEKMCGGVMPAPKTDAPAEPLPQAQIDLIRAWITQGAKNN